MNRRTVLRQAVGSAGLTLSGTMLGRPTLLAQDATPTTGVANIGPPEITLTVNDVGFIVPTGITAGRMLMIVKNTGSKPLHFFAARIPDEVTDEQLAAEMASDSEPEWFDMTKLRMLGNPDWPAPGGQALGVVDVTAGRWTLVDPIDGRDVTIWTVGEEENEITTPEPQADIEVGLTEMEFSGLDQPVTAGSNTWKISNHGALEHELAILPVEPGTTPERVVEQISGMLQGTEDASFWQPVGGQGIASKSVISWQFFDLQSGTYAAVCMTPSEGDDPESFVPHALMGMVKVFTVA